MRGERWQNLYQDHSQGKLNLLSQQRGDQHGIVRAHQTHAQQCHLLQRSMIFNHQHKKLLPWHANSRSWICPHLNHWHSWGVHLWIWPCWKRKPQWVDLLWNRMWLLWDTPSWHTSHQSPLWSFRKGGLLQSHYNARPLETQMTTNTVLHHHQWFWHWIPGHWALQLSPLGPTKVPPSPNQYGRRQDCG